LNGIEFGTPLDISSYSATSITSDEVAKIGKDANAAYWNGQAADLKIYENTVLSAANVKELYDDSKVIIPTKNDASGGFVTQTNLMGWWPLVEGAGILCYDGSGNGRTGTITNGEGDEWLTGQTGCPQLVEGYNRPMTFGGRYITGSATQTSYNITGVGTAWTSAMVGRDFVFGTAGSSGTILEVTSATALGVDVSKEVTPAESYVIGGTDYVSVGSPSAIDFIWSDNFSVSAWIWLDNNSGFKHIIGKSFSDYRLCANGTQLSWRLDSNSPIAAGGTMGAKQWHHVVGTWETDSSTGGTAKVYLNGALVGTATSAATWTDTGGVFQIGNSSGENYWFEGIINECIAYNKTLSLAEVQVLAARANTSYADTSRGPLPPNPLTLSDRGNVVGYWRNDGNVTWADRSSNTNTATVYGSPDDLLFKQGYNGQKSTSTGRDGQGFSLKYQNNGAIGFNGTDAIGDYIDCGDLGTIGDRFTYSVWFKTGPSTAATYRMFICVDGNTNGNPQLRIYNGNVQMRFYSDNSLASSGTYWDGEWHQAVGGINGSGDYFLYVDGVSQGTLTPISYTVSWSGNTRIGKYNYDGGKFFEGQIANAQIYDRALTYAEIQQNYNSFKSRFGE
jgi:hypothetical protein